MKFSTKYLLLMIIGLTVCSCMVPRTSPKTVICPTPEQGCESTQWRGIPFDTSVISSQVLGWYYVIEPLSQINSPEDEWHLAFLDSKRAVFMYNDSEIQKLMIVRMVRPDKFSTESGIHIPFEGHTGPLSIRNGVTAFSAIPDRPDELKLGLIDRMDDRVSREIGDKSFEKRYGIETESDGRKVILYELPYEGVTGNSMLFTSNLDKNQLKDIKALSEDINLGFYTWEAQPALSPDGNVMFYASDRSDGMGGTDIWFTINLGNNNWSAPFNAGDSVNSKCDELTPFVSNDGKTMLFSSAGHQTVGGYDIFSISISDEFWRDAKSKNIDKISKGKNYFTKLRNLRPPLNTEYDELFPSCPGDCDSIIYYSSNQGDAESSIVRMRGGFDLYVRYKEKSPYVIAQTRKDKQGVDIKFDVEGQEQTLKTPELKAPEKYTVQGTVVNQETLQPVSDADITVKEMPSDEIYTQTTTNQAGKYQVELEKDREFEISAQGKDLFFDSFKMRVDRDDPVKIVTRDIALPEIFHLRVNFPFDDYSNPYRFTLDSTGIESNRTWQEELDLLTTNLIASKDKISKISIVGHTDFSGSQEYNQRLGQRRVDFIIAQLVKRGVPEAMLERRSAGKLEPLPKLPGEDDSLYKKRLRRVTLEKIMK